MNISILGDLCIDKNTSEHASYVSAGGAVMFLYRICKQFPDCIATIIASYGVDYVPYLDYVSIIPSSPNFENTLVYENISKNGIRQQRAYNREGIMPFALDDKAKSVLSKSDIIFIAPLLPNFSINYFYEVKLHAKEDCLIVLLPQGFYRNFDSRDNVIVREFTEAKEITEHVDIVITSERDHSNMINMCKQWSQNNPNLITAVTKAEKGATIIQRNIETNVPTIPVDEKDIVDSVGAGDAFSAGFTYQYKKTHDILKAGKFANAVARQKLFFKADQTKLDFQSEAFIGLV